jgi:hypothetical protein
VGHQFVAETERRNSLTAQRFASQRIAPPLAASLRNRAAQKTEAATLLLTQIKK